MENHSSRRYYGNAHPKAPKPRYFYDIHASDSKYDTAAEIITRLPDVISLSSIELSMFEQTKITDGLTKHRTLFKRREPSPSLITNPVLSSS